MKNRKLLYWIAGIGIAVVALALSAVLKAQTGQKIWVEVGGAPDGFTIAFPAKPQHRSQELSVPDSSEIIVQDAYSLVTPSDDASYFFTRSLQPNEIGMDNPQLVLDTALDAMLETSASNTLENKTSLEINGAPGLRFAIFDGGSNIRYDGLVAYKGRALYQAFVSAPTGREDRKKTGRFLASFSIR